MYVMIFIIWKWGNNDIMFMYKILYRNMFFYKWDYDKEGIWLIGIGY